MSDPSRDIDSERDKYDEVVIQNLLGTDSANLHDALKAQLSGTDSLKEAITALRQDSGLSSEDQTKLDTLGWILQAANGSLGLVKFCLDKASPDDGKSTKSAIAVSPQALALKIMTLQRDAPGVPSESDWVHLRERLFTAESTSVIIGLIQSDQVPVRPENCKDYVVALLQRAVDILNFDIAKESIRDLLPTSDRGKELFAETGIPPTEHSVVSGYLCTLQRLQRIVNEPADTGALIRAGFTSADVIARHGAKRANRKMVKYGIPSDRADQIFKLATLIASRNEHLSTRALTLRGVGNRGAQDLATIKSTEHNFAEIEQEDVNFDTMFGLDNLGCEDCGSITGSAAFFVDLLQTLDTMDIGTSSDTSSVSLLSKLLERRPDLGELELSCGNTDVLIPYVDIVNEALETVVWRLNQNIQPIIDPYNASDRETEMANLMQPQNTNYEVYQKVVQPLVAPMHSFPYNQATQSIRAYLSALGVSRSELLNVFRSPYAISEDEALSKDINEALRHAESAEILNLQREDWVAITKQGFFAQGLAKALPGGPASEAEYNASIGLQTSSQYWGFESNSAMLDPKDGLAKIKYVLLSRSGMTFDDLLAATRALYLEEVFIIEILRGEDGLDPQPRDLLDNMRLRKWGSGAVAEDLDEAICDRLQRFIRLHRKVGWPVEELDAVMVTLADDKTSFTPDLLDNLAAVKQLAELTERSPKNLQPLWGDICTHGESSLFSELFFTAILPSKVRKQLPQIANDEQIPFASVSQAMENEELTIATIMMALNLTPEELDAICATLKIDLSAELTLANISAVYRVSMLCKILKVSPLSYSTLLSIYEPEWDPFRDPLTTLAMVKDYMPKEPSTKDWTLDRLAFVINKVPSKTDQACQPSVDQYIKVIDAVKAALKDPTLKNVKQAMDDGTLLAGLVEELITDPETRARVLTLLQGVLDEGFEDVETLSKNHADVTDEQFLTQALEPVIGTKLAGLLSSEVIAAAPGQARCTVFMNAFLPARYQQTQYQTIVQTLTPFFPTLSAATLQFSLEKLIQAQVEAESDETMRSGMDIMLSIGEADTDNPGVPFSGYFRPPASGTYLILAPGAEGPTGAVLDETPLTFQKRAQGMVPEWEAETVSLVAGRWYKLRYSGQVDGLRWLFGDTESSPFMAPAVFNSNELIDGAIIKWLL